MVEATDHLGDDGDDLRVGVPEDRAHLAAGEVEHAPPGGVLDERPRGPLGDERRPRRAVPHEMARRPFQILLVRHRPIIASERGRVPTRRAGCRGQTVAVGSQRFVGGLRAATVTSLLLALVGLAAGCTTRTESSAPAGESAEEAAAPAPASRTSPTDATSTAVPDSSAPRRPARRRPPPRSPRRRRPPSNSTTVPTTTSAPVVGQFDCIPAGEQLETWEIRPPSDIPAPELPEGWTTAVFGRSVQGRGIEVIVRPVDLAARRVLVIGGLHGNEPVTPPAVRGLLKADIESDIEVWLVPVANPDGSAAGLRCNANGVDLNRNFPGNGGPRTADPLRRANPRRRRSSLLVEGLRPDVVVWVHQPLGYVSEIGASGSESNWHGPPRRGCRFGPTSPSTAAARAGRRSWPGCRRC